MTTGHNIVCAVSLHDIDHHQPQGQWERGRQKVSNTAQPNEMPKPGQDFVEPFARQEFDRVFKLQIAKGMRKYGTGLQIFNSLDAIECAMQEAIDLWMYLSQIKMERGQSGDTKMQALRDELCDAKADLENAQEVVRMLRDELRQEQSKCKHCHKYMTGQPHSQQLDCSEINRQFESAAEQDQKAAPDGPIISSCEAMRHWNELDDMPYLPHHDGCPISETCQSVRRVQQALDGAHQRADDLKAKLANSEERALTLRKEIRIRDAEITRLIETNRGLRRDFQDLQRRLNAQPKPSEIGGLRRRARELEQLLETARAEAKWLRIKKDVHQFDDESGSVFDPRVKTCASPDLKLPTDSHTHPGNYDMTPITPIAMNGNGHDKA